jgi:dephospho-CoA kinase
MAAQLSEEEKQRRAAHIIWNDGNVSVIHRVLSLLKSLE